MLSRINNRHRNTLAAIFAEPVNGNLQWSRIEALLLALDCELSEGPGSSVTVKKDECKTTIHRPHPVKEALKYRVKLVRAFLQQIEVRP